MAYVHNVPHSNTSQWDTSYLGDTVTHPDVQSHTNPQPDSTLHSSNTPHTIIHMNKAIQVQDPLENKWKTPSNHGCQIPGRVKSIIYYIAITTNLLYNHEVIVCNYLVSQDSQGLQLVPTRKAICPNIWSNFENTRLCSYVR